MIQISLAKFGGTSLSSYETMTNCAKIVQKNPTIKVIVVSATGGTTDKLVKLTQAIVKNEDQKKKELLQSIFDKHLKIAEQISTQTFFVSHIKSIFKELESLANEYNSSNLDNKGRDLILSFGERLSSYLFTHCLEKIIQNKNIKLLDSREIIITDNNFGEATPQLKKIQEQVQKKISSNLDDKKIVVTQGFIGSSKDSGETTTLGRGGSDYSAAILAASIPVNSLQIWTDVPGVSTIDPKITKEARNVSELSYCEAAELAYLGAKVLHPLTLIPVMDMNIPVYVASSFEPEKPGTWIKKSPSTTNIFRAIAIKEEQCIITLSKIKKLNAYGFLSQVFSIFTKYKVSINHVTTSEISTSITMQDFSKIPYQLIEELKQFADIKVDDHLVQISIIGDDITKKEVLSQITNSINAPIKSLFLGASKNNISLLIDKKHSNKTILSLHNNLLQLQQG